MLHPNAGQPLATPRVDERKARVKSSIVVFSSSSTDLLRINSG